MLTGRFALKVASSGDTSRAIAHAKVNDLNRKFSAAV